MSINNRDLYHFLEIARSGQLARAAASAGLTPAAISKAVRRLESELGLRLFERTGRGMVLTAYGQVFARQAARAVEALDVAMIQAGDVRAGRAGLVRIGTTVAMLETRIAPALGALQPRRPALHARVNIAESSVVIGWLRDARLDLAVVPSYEADFDDLSEAPLAPDAFAPVVREGHPLLSRRRLSPADLAGAGWILPARSTPAATQIEKAFAVVGATMPAATIEVDLNTAWTASIVRATDLIAFMAGNPVAGFDVSGLRNLGMRALTVPRRVSLLRRAGAELSPVAEELASLLQSQARAGRRSG
jgi:DNA-binding transcriptional LysR family regulator